ncbi:MAG: 23S rRNA (adenine(2503)-C(2))-methyltransferase RlmN [Alphaproteobacteria bacterium]|nr:23S rRNA (adenine(2503)-C(2))-methyltransferase RlmN [Alphaproteobacteria bacterium]MBU0797219.1 23S rRNA (adenine(2503)-C(2))-methyltransferase RlmN [Alphaproteobacteria bacterium]MBU0888993.1 23S rRNA (adenine(2503)-C(2))-methyltransferase RlmN [Alphaproteobacteria bacterium]MBU1814013.1 23S rRNA (adenine(2503)-C(2))-methyltransferase RlmN [Alphaproteobacteria bacterium]MBU2089745.1 23S rRNA (adenine(2503)-C(2))-methyltransferase RlmN [Alphaproteobacteria bacterium]
MSAVQTLIDDIWKPEPVAPVLPLALRPNLVGMDRTDMAAAFAAMGLPAFRMKQVWSWVYHRGITDFELMTDIAKDLRGRLAENFRIARPEVKVEQVSTDGTIKWLLRFEDGNEVETVFIPEEDRGTLCVSSQVGCTLACKFCHTGTQRWVRNLGAAEIVGQVMMARDRLGEWPASMEGRHFTNIVMMGMGEPLYNYDNVAKALKLIMDGDGVALSKRKITLSTAGVVPAMAKCGEELGVNLAVSLHAVTDEIRDQIVPLNRKYKIAELMQACRDYPGVSNARRITFEYVMLKGINDSDQDAHALVKLLEGIPAKVNLIPFNPWPDSPYECSSNTRIDRFSKILMAAGFASPVRKTRGQDILAACGQLKSASEKLKKSERPAVEA